MATAPDMLLIEEEPPVASEGLMLQDILTPGVNLADWLDESQLTKIGQDVIRDVEIDEQSRGDWQKRYDKCVDVAMQVKKAKNTPWPKAANVKLPILTVAAIQFQAEAYPVIVDGSNLVKGRVLGPDPDGTKRARADRMGQHMTYQLLYKMESWEEETDRLLLLLPITGMVIRKVYYDSTDSQNCSEIIPADDFIINYWAKSIEKAPRFTHVLNYYPYEVEELIAAGTWREVPIDDNPEGSSGDDSQALGEYYEQHRTLDLDMDGRPEHYVVTTTKEGKVARIAPCFGPENVKVRNLADGTVIELSKLIQAQRPDLAGEIVKVERRQYFIKYGFIPSPDGSFYDIGFGTLLESITDGSDTLANQMLDAASLQNAQGGFLGSGVNVRGGNFRFSLGEWKRVDSTGGPLKDNILPMQTPGPSAVSFSLLELLLASAKDITSSQDVVAGRAPANQPATTTLALLEQAQTVRKGIYKRIHRSFGKECRALRRLNRDYLDEEEYFQLLEPEPVLGPDGQPQMGQDGKPLTNEVGSIGRQDYEDEDLDVIPVSDPGQVSDVQKAARAEALMTTFNGDPLINQKEIRRDFLVAVGAKDIPRYFEVPPPQPDPKTLAEIGKVQVAKQDAETRRTVGHATATEKLMSAAEKAVTIGLVPDAAQLAAYALEESQEEDANEPADGPGGVPGMEGLPDDPGLSGLPPGEAAPSAPGMGGGAAPFEQPGIPGAGGSAGETGEPQL